MIQRRERRPGDPIRVQIDEYTWMEHQEGNGPYRQFFIACRHPRLTREFATSFQMSERNTGPGLSDRAKQYIRRQYHELMARIDQEISDTI